MQRFAVALCLSISLAALGLAAFSVSRNGARGEPEKQAPGEDLAELRRLVSALADRVARLEGRQTRVEEVAAGRGRSLVAAAVEGRDDGAGPGDEDEAAGLEAQIEALTQRLARLEDEETIARLARSGEAHVTEKELRGALHQVGDREAPAEARLEAFERLRRAMKTHGPMLGQVMKENELGERDIVLPILELAQDRTVDPDLRAEAVHSLRGSEVEEIRQPMLDMLALDAEPEVRNAAIDVLIYHARDAAVREGITRASQDDPVEDVRRHAQRYMPKLQWFQREAAEEQAGQQRGGK